MTLVGKNKDGIGSDTTSKLPKLDNASTNYVVVLPNDGEICPNCGDKGYLDWEVSSSSPAGTDKHKYRSKCYCGRGKVTRGNIERFNIEQRSGNDVQ